ncbi:hypothetical protein ACFL5Y_00230 [Candidatus Omnitrophota bacterium]
MSYMFMPASLLHSETGFLLPQKGMCYVTWDKDRFASQYSDQSLEKLSDMGVEYISIIVTQYQEQYNSTKIKKTEKTPTDKSIIHAINKAHKLGLKVMLKPHIDLLDKYDGTYWRADIGFASENDWKKWFREYKKFILHYAEMAKELEVDIFCVGTELSFTTQKDSFWRDEIIATVRAAYPGKLLYAANWDNYKNVNFWKDLDYVGIDAYFPLTHKVDPSVEDLKKGWEKWICELETWQVLTNKPIIFTEIGYPSTQHAPYLPWKGGTEGNAAPEIQARCYEAFFETVWNQPWLAGVYWWKWDTNIYSGGKHNRQFTPQNKPAQQILESNYKGFKKISTFAKTP